MALLAGVRAEFNQQQDTKYTYTFDFGKACKTPAGAIVTTIADADVAATSGIMVGGSPTINSTTVQVQVDTSGVAVSTDPYVVLVAATLANTDVVPLAIQINVTAKADTT